MQPRRPTPNRARRARGPCSPPAPGRLGLESCLPCLGVSRPGPSESLGVSAPGVPPWGAGGSQLVFLGCDEWVAELVGPRDPGWEGRDPSPPPAPTPQAPPPRPCCPPGLSPPENSGHQAPGLRVHLGPHGQG